MAALAALTWAAALMPALADTLLPQTPAEQRLVGSGAKIVKRFQSGSGLTAIVAENGKERRLFYLTPDGKSTILGIIFGPDGKNTTVADMAKMDPVPVATAAAVPSGQLIARAQKLPYIQEGTGGKVIYAVFDPNCMYCHGLYSRLRGAVAQGQVQIRWIPVSILATSGAATIASIYGAKDHAAALGQAFNHILPPSDVSKQAEVAMAQNLLLLNDTSYKGVPVLLYEDNGQAQVHRGAPTDAELANILKI